MRTTKTKPRAAKKRPMSAPARGLTNEEMKKIFDIFICIDQIVLDALTLTLDARDAKYLKKYNDAIQRLYDNE